MNIYNKKQKHVQYVTSCGLYRYPTMPFVTYLGAYYKIYNWKKLKPYTLNHYWCDYRYNMVRLGMDYESRDNFGCWG